MSLFGTNGRIILVATVNINKQSPEVDETTKN